MTLPIDIIVPVYRGLQDVKDCLDSVLASANESPYELIVIDDCSPEPEVSRYLKQQAERGLFTLLVNDVNLGFVATVNRGMQLHEDRDVLLLNSDTIVVNDWVDRIKAAAYDGENVGTVTPFSNNATICSYPTFCQDNTLETNTPLPLLDKIFSMTNAGKSVDVPTGVGFCMYIRRACLEEVGYFDVEQFGKGYGEENDFCQRVIKSGWVNRFTLDVFVQHTGNVSFGDEHNELKHTALSKVLERHPTYERQVHEHIAADPAKTARVSAWLASLVAGDQSIVVHVAHNRGGGSLRFVKELSDSIENHMYSLMLMPSLKKPGYLCLTKVLASPDGLQPLESEYTLYFEAETQKKLLISVLKKLPISGFHFHHMLDLPDWVMSLPQALSVDWFVSIHDFYFACPSIVLIDHNDRFSGPDADKLDNSCCPDFGKGSEHEVWRNRFAPLLDGAKACYAPSVDCTRRMQVYFPNASIRTVYHQNSAHFDTAYHPGALSLEDGADLNVVVIGALGKVKGADLLEDVAKLCREKGLKIHFELLGYAYRDLITHPKSNLVVAGRYHESELVESLKEKRENGKAHLVWFTSQVPETFSYTFSSAMEAQMPVLVPNIGAFPERVYGRPSSWVIPWDSKAEDVCKVLLDIVTEGTDSEQLSKLKSAVQPDRSGFHYDKDYIPLLKCVGVSKTNKNDITRWLQFALPLVDGKPNPQQVLKTRIISILYRLRCSTLLRPVVRRVPLKFQREVKSWLSR